MTHKMVCMLLIGAASLCGSHSARAEMWNAVDQFNTTSNTANDTWQYLYAEGDGSNNAGYANFAAYTAGAPGYAVWCNNTEWHFAGKNESVFDGLVAHPYGWAGIYYISAIGWKSPIDGFVDADFSVQDLNAAEGDGQSWALFKSGETTPLSSGTIDNGGNSGLLHVGNVPVSTGDMLYLQIGSRTDYVGDLTGIHFTVTSVPEPSALLLLGCAAMGVLALGWRKLR